MKNNENGYCYRIMYIHYYLIVNNFKNGLIQRLLNYPTTFFFTSLIFKTNLEYAFQTPTNCMQIEGMLRYCGL